MKNKNNKYNKGLTFLEIIISTAILAIISLALLSSMTGQFKLIRFTQDITLSVAAAQQSLEVMIQDVKAEIKDGEEPDGKTNYIVFAGKPYQRSVGGYPRSMDIQIQKSTTSLFTIVADYTMPEFPVASASVSIRFSNDSIVAYQELPSLSVNTAVTINDPHNVNMVNIYRWYVSRPGFNSPMVSNPDEIEIGKVYPRFPDDYTIIPGATGTYLTPVLTQYAGRHLICTVTPAANSGKMGVTAVSNPVFVSGLPVINNLMLHLDASMISADYGTSIAQWNDISGGNRHAIQTNTARQPVLVNAKIADTDYSGKSYETYAKYMSFDNVDDSMLTSALSSLNVSNNTVFLVVRNAGEENFSIYRDDMTGKPLSIRTNDKRVVIGYTGVTGYSAFDIAEVIIYNGSLSSENRILVETYLQNKYLPVKSVISIHSLLPITDKVIKNESYNMPSTVPANMSNSTVRYVAVDWLPEQIDTSTSGLKESVGTATQDNTKTTTLTVNVLSITGLNNLNATVEKGSNFVFPEKTVATLSDGSFKSVDVKWHVSSVNTDNLGDIVITGEAVLDSTQHLTLTISVVPVSVTKVWLNKETTSIVRQSTETLFATIEPSNASNKNVSWKTSNSTIATVSDEGVVTGISGGKATITVETEDGKHIASCEVTVTGSEIKLIKIDNTNERRFRLEFDKNIKSASINTSNVTIAINNKRVTFTRPNNNPFSNGDMEISVTSNDNTTTKFIINKQGNTYTEVK